MSCLKWLLLLAARLHMHAWRVTLELVESELYLWSPCGEQICLIHYIHFNTMVQSHLQIFISGESRLDTNSLTRLKTEMGVLQ